MAEVFLIMTVICGISAVIMLIGIISNICDSIFDNRFTNGFNDLMDVCGEFAIFASVATAGFAGLVSIVHTMFF